MLKCTLSITFSLLYHICLSQQAKVDTTIDGVTYHYINRYKDGNIKSVSENRTRKEGGNWLYFTDKGIWKAAGKYNTNGQKEGEWFYYYTAKSDSSSTLCFSTRRYKNGKDQHIIGNGCVCPAF